MFRNIKREGVRVQKEAINEHFQGVGKVNGKTNGIGRGRLI